MLVPQRDVDVVYRMAPLAIGPAAGAAERPTDQGLTQRLRWLTVQRRLRVDPPGGATFMIVDYAGRRMQMVEPGPREVIDMPSPPGLGDVAPQGARFERLGEDSVAQLRCTNWRTLDQSGQATIVCLTQDGVLLRAGRRGAALAEASSVSYGAQDPALFQVPDGFRHVAPPTATALPAGPPAGALQ